MSDRMSSDEFQKLLREGGLIPSKRGVISKENMNEDWKDKLRTKAPMGRPKVTDRPLKTNAPKPGQVAKKVKVRKRPPSNIIRDDIIQHEREYWIQQGGLYIPYQVMSLKNSKRVLPYLDVDERPKITVQPSNAFITYSMLSAPSYQKGRAWFKEQVADLPKPYLVGIYFLRKTSASYDFHNMVHGPLDFMKDFNYIADDDTKNIIAFPVGSQISRDAPGLVLFVLKAEQIPFWRGIEHEEREVPL